MKPFISVALCTYNGESFIEEQLQSILNQTVEVNEILVMDDCSSDNTVSIIKRIQQTSKVPIILHEQAENQGYVKNFESCVRACKGDLIFFSDQDDIWLPEKVQVMVGLFEKNPNWNAVFSNAKIINQSGIPTGGTAFDAIQFTREQQAAWRQGKAFELLLRGYIVTGATLAIRKDVVNHVFPVPMIIKNLIHDGWIAVYLSMFNQIGFTDSCLIAYRTHEKQQVGFGKMGKKITLFDRFKRARAEKLNRILPKLKDAEALYDHLVQLPETPENVLVLLNSRKDHFHFRYQLPENRLLRILPIFSRVVRGKYQQHEVGMWWRTILGDLFE